MIKSNMRPYQKSAVQYRLHGGFFSFDHNNKTGKYRILGMDDTDRGTSYLLKIAAVDLPDRFAPTLNTGDGSSELKKNENGEHSGGGGRYENVLVFLYGMENRNHTELRCTGGLPFLSDFLPCLKKRGPGTAEKFAFEFVRILVGEGTEKTVHDGSCQIQRAKSTSKRFWSYNIYINDITDLPKITDNLELLKKELYQ